MSHALGPPNLKSGWRPFHELRRLKVRFQNQLLEAAVDIALIGLAFMGQNLVLNMNDHGIRVAVFNRTVSKMDDFLANKAKGAPIIGAHSIPEPVAYLKRPAGL